MIYMLYTGIKFFTAKRSQMSNLSFPENRPECEIVTTRVFNIPRQLVFQAWTDPAHLNEWWGPNGFTNTFHIFDFREGGCLIIKFKLFNLNQSCSTSCPCWRFN